MRDVTLQVLYEIINDEITLETVEMILKNRKIIKEDIKEVEEILEKIRHLKDIL